MAKKTAAKNQPTADDLKAPLLAAVGAADPGVEAAGGAADAVR
jgi:heparin binding hemagglutinin HbhA